MFGTPILMNAGTKQMPLSSCTVIPISLHKELSEKEIRNTIYPYYNAGMGSGFNLN